MALHLPLFDDAVTVSSARFGISSWLEEMASSVPANGFVA